MLIPLSNRLDSTLRLPEAHLSSVEIFDRSLDIGSRTIRAAKRSPYPVAVSIHEVLINKFVQAVNSKNLRPNDG